MVSCRSLVSLFYTFLGNDLDSSKLFDWSDFLESGTSLFCVVILQLFSRGPRMEFDGSYHDTFSGYNNQRHDPFTEFHRQNDGRFSSKFYKIFSEVVSCPCKHILLPFVMSVQTAEYEVILIFFVFRFSSKT